MEMQQKWTQKSKIFQSSSALSVQRTLAKLLSERWKKFVWKIFKRWGGGLCVIRHLNLCKFSSSTSLTSNPNRKVGLSDGNCIHSEFISLPRSWAQPNSSSTMLCVMTYERPFQNLCKAHSFTLHSAGKQRKIREHEKKKLSKEVKAKYFDDRKHGVWKDIRQKGNFALPFMRKNVFANLSIRLSN